MLNPFGGRGASTFVITIWMVVFSFFWTCTLVISFLVMEMGGNPLLKKKKRCKNILVVLGIVQIIKCSTNTPQKKILMKLETKVSVIWSVHTNIFLVVLGISVICVSLSKKNKIRICVLSANQSALINHVPALFGWGSNLQTNLNQINMYHLSLGGRVCCNSNISTAIKLTRKIDSPHKCTGLYLRVGLEGLYTINQIINTIFQNYDMFEKPS